MKARFLIFSVCILSAIQTAVLADDVKSLQGVWKPEKAELAGTAMPEAAIKTITLKIKGDKYEVTVEGEGPDKGTCKLDTKAKPKRMSIYSIEGANKGKTFPAIYEVKGDTLKVCYDLSGKDYPAEFKTAKKTMLYLVTYRRQKQ